MNPHTEQLIANTIKRIQELDKSVALIRQQADKIADLQTTIKFLEEECKALRGQVSELQ